MSNATPDLPYAPRVLSASELKKLDVYFFESPKLARRVTVIGPTALALALQLEFDADIVTYVERPRTLTVDTTDIDLSFWTRTRKGNEQFSLITVSSDGSTAALLARNRRREAVVSAAQAAHLALQFVPQSSLTATKTTSTNRLRLLPYVQTAAEVPQADVIEERVMALFELQPRLAFAQIERAVPEFDYRDARAVTCALIHRGALRLDFEARLHVHAMVEKRSAT